MSRGKSLAFVWLPNLDSIAYAISRLILLPQLTMDFVSVAVYSLPPR